MIETKFRAWDKVSKRILSPRELQDLEIHVDPRTGSFVEDEDNSCGDPECCGGPCPSWQEQDNLLPMQYIGLKDKNGKGIYEGYIVRVDGNNRLVERDEDRTGFKPFSEQIFSAADTYSEWRYEEIEIIGNIYENPELLENK